MDQLTALAELHFNWADTPDHVWADSPYHVDGLHTDALATLDRGIREAAASTGPSPIGLVLQGQKGIGKTHLLGLVRRHTHRMGGYFFLDNLTAGEAFWENTAEALRSGLSRMDDTGDTQLASFLRRVCRQAGIGAATAQIVGGKASPGSTSTRSWPVCANWTGRSPWNAQTSPGPWCCTRARTRRAAKPASPTSAATRRTNAASGASGESARASGRALSLVRDITRLLALTGPVVIAVDQLDTLIARSAQKTQQTGPDDLLVAQIADGLMELREVTRRTMTVLACLPNTWMRIRQTAADTVPDRFREARSLGRITDGALAKALVEKRFEVDYGRCGSCRRTRPGRSPRPRSSRPGCNGPRVTCGNASGTHFEWCVRNGQVRELTTFGDEPLPELPAQPAASPDRFHDLDTWFAELRPAGRRVRVALRTGARTRLMPELLDAALRSWINEVGDDNMEWKPERADSDHNELHAWLTHTVDEASDLQERWAFRTIFAPHHLAVLNRLRKALTAAGIAPGRGQPAPGADPQREMVRWRQDARRNWPGSANRADVSWHCPNQDARTFWALDAMLDKGVDAELLDWLVERRPASRSSLLSSVLPQPGRAARR